MLGFLSSPIGLAIQTIGAGLFATWGGITGISKGVDLLKDALKKDKKGE
jgi:hypothetical protein